MSAKAARDPTSRPASISPPPTTTTSAPHAVVIGSGFGGLAAAVRLASRGYRVTVLERKEAPGGRAITHRENGFVFDGGPTVVTAPFLFEELWQLAGRRLEDDVDLRPVSPFYRIRFSDGEWFDYSGDADKMCSEVERFSPSDVAGYKKFVRESEAIFKVGFEQLAHVPFGSWSSMARIMPDMMKLQSYRTVYGLAAKYIRDERLRQVFSFHPLLVGGNPFSTTSIYSLILFLERRWGVHYPIGGTGALVDGLVKLIEGMGSEVRMNASVEQIIVRHNGKRHRAHGVRLNSGEEIAADIVVSNADSAWTYKHLVPAEARRRWTDDRIEKSRYSMSLFVWYFGTNRVYGDVAHHSILLGPRYKELLHDIFKRHFLADDFSLYLHRPTATDPSMAPAGSDTFYVLSPVPHMDSGVDWQEEAPRYQQRICEFLERTVLPDLSKHVVASRVLTPQMFHDDLQSFKGAAFGMEPVLTQSAYFRPHNASEDVERLYLVGAG
ncbi:MAG: phytoene desaturase, partial [Clostridia bacterium]|nr:phytoene desaturase [Deltaproteobacteria bacterium]